MSKTTIKPGSYVDTKKSRLHYLGKNKRFHFWYSETENVRKLTPISSAPPKATGLSDLGMAHLRSIYPTKGTHFLAQDGKECIFIAYDPSNPISFEFDDVLTGGRYFFDKEA